MVGLTCSSAIRTSLALISHFLVPGLHQNVEAFVVRVLSAAKVTFVQLFLLLRCSHRQRAAAGLRRQLKCISKEGLHQVLNTCHLISTRVSCPRRPPPRLARNQQVGQHEQSKATVEPETTIDSGAQGAWDVKNASIGGGPRVHLGAVGV